jgi:hypothetical protein
MAASFLAEHSLSIGLAAIWIVLSAVSALPAADSWLGVWLANHAGGAGGALMIVVATKYWRERGSAESK